MKHHECCFCEVSVVKSMVEFSTKWWSPLGLRAETQNGLNNNRGEHILGQRSASEEIQRFIVKSRRLGVDNTSGWNFKKKSFCEFPWWYTSEPQLWTYCISVPGLPLICCFSFLFSPWLFIYLCSLLFFSLGDLFPHHFFFLSYFLLFPFYRVHLFLTDHHLELKRYSVVVSSSDSGVRQKSSSAVWLLAFYLTSLSLIFLICKMRLIM